MITVVIVVVVMVMIMMPVCSNETCYQFCYMWRIILCALDIRN